MNITQNKITQADHKQNILFDQVPYGILFIDSNGIILDINTTGCLMFGYEKKDLLKMDIKSLISKEHLISNPLKLEELNKGIPLIFERKFIQKNGAIIDTEIMAQKLQDGNIQGIIRDITEQKQSSELLKQSLYQLEEAQKIAHTGHLELNLVTGVIKWSNETFRIHGCDPEKFTPTLENTVDFVHPEDAAFVQKELHLAMVGEKKYDLHHRIINANGETVYVRVKADLSFDPSGKPIKMLGTITDITEITQIKHKQELSARVLELLVKNAPLPVILETMVLGAEQYSSGTFCSILLIDKEGKRLLHGAAPNLPDFYNKAIHGVEIGMGVGSCATAAFTGNRVIVDNIQEHPYWKQYKELASKAGLAACWSEPILDASDKVLGSFAIYCTKPCSPKPNDIVLIEHLANLAAIVLKRSYASASLKASERRLALTLDSTLDMMGLVTINEKEEFIFNTGNKANIEFINKLGIDEQNYFGAELKGYLINYLGFTKEEALETEKKYQQVVKERKPVKVQSSFQDPTGNVFYSETTLNPVFEEDGKIEQVLYVVRNTTEARTAESALQASEKKLALTLDSTVDMMGLMDINEAGEFIFNTANRAARESFKLMGTEEKAYFGAELKSYCMKYLGFTKEEAFDLEKKYKQVVKEGKPVVVSSSSPTPQGGLIHIETTINPVFGDNGKVEQVLWVNKDVTEAKKAEEQLLISKQKLNEAQKIAKIGSWELNLLTFELTWSKEHYRIFELEGTSPDKLYEAYRNKIFPDDLQKLDELIKRTIDTGESSSFEYRISCKNGHTKYILSICNPIKNNDGKLIGLKGTCQDITHKAEVQKQQIRSIITGEENERKRLSAELHDGLGQTLSLISLNLDSVLNLDDKKGELAQKKLHASLEMVNQTIEEIRSISRGLIPPALEDFGLESELEDMLKKANLSTGITVDFSFDRAIGRCEPDIEINIYRIIQEALHNTLKHADARKISISIYEKKGFLTILHKDDGKGFDPEKKKNTYRGLKNIENRVFVLGGTLSVQSFLQQGTTLSIKIPV